MKVLILLFIVGAATAGKVLYTYPTGYVGYPTGYVGYPTGYVGYPGYGVASQYRTQDTAGNYAFSYHEPNYPFGSYHHETGSAGGAKAGSYGVKLADGKVQIVDYTADSAGFRANIKTNQKGVDTSKTPAAVTIQEAKIEEPKFPTFPGAYVAYYKR